MKMRSSRVLDKLRAGEIVSCFKINLACARAAEIVAMCGFDCIWTDMEHVANDWSIVEKQVWAAKTQNVDVMVRVARGGYSDYIKPLELDASGIMVPHVMSLADAKKVVRMTRFHPVGRRPIDGGNADGAYCNMDILEYTKQANEKRFVVIQIEDPEPLDDLEDIVSLDGIDMIFFGQLDFSHAIGAPGVLDHPKVIKMRKRIAKVAIAHGKFAGIGGTPDNMDELISMGYRFITIGSDVVGLSQYCKSTVAEFRKHTQRLKINFFR